MLVLHLDMGLQIIPRHKSVTWSRSGPQTAAPSSSLLCASATSWPRKVTFGFSESFLRLVLRSHSRCMCWADRCHFHGLGYPFDYLRNLYTFFWQVVSLCRRRQILINSSCVKFHKNSSSSSVVYSDRRTDGEDVSAFLILYVVSLSKVNQMEKKWREYVWTVRQPSYNFVPPRGIRGEQSDTGTGFF